MVETVMAAVQRAALQLPPRRAALESAKIRTISRAEGGQLQAPVGRQSCDWSYRERLSACVSGIR
jgi:hypothetical protein